MSDLEYKRSDGKNAKKYEHAVTTKKVCPICGEEFEARVWNRKTCYKKECEITNTLLMVKTKEERYKNGEYCSVLKDREFTCERCNKVFIKHTTNRKKFRFCDKCINDIQKEQRHLSDIQKYGTSLRQVGQGNLAIYTDTLPDKVLKRTSNNQECCYLCGRVKTNNNHLKLEEHHLNNIHNFNINYNKVILCTNCHNRLHRIYNRLRQLGVSFPETIKYEGKTYSDS